MGIVIYCYLSKKCTLSFTSLCFSFEKLTWFPFVWCWGREESVHLFPSFITLKLLFLVPLLLGKGKSKGKEHSITFKIQFVLLSGLSMYQGSRYWFFCKYFNNEIPIKNLPFALPFSCWLFTTLYQGLASYNETSIIFFLIGSFIAHYFILNKTNLKSHPVILQSHKLVCN